MKKLLQEAKKEYGFKDTDEFWLIIDRDDWEQIHHHNFDRLAAECKAEGNFFMAMSNPCFEIWLLLHFKNVDDYNDDEKQKMMINKKVSSGKTYLDKELSDTQGRGYNKRPNPKEFLPLTQTAIARAKALDKNKADYPKELGTHVYKLIEKITIQQ